MAGELAKILTKNPYEAPNPSPYAESNSEAALAVKAVDNPYAFGHLVGAQMRNKGRQSVYRADLSKANYLGAQNKKASAEMQLKAGMLSKIIDQPGGIIALKDLFPQIVPLLKEQARLDVSTKKAENIGKVTTAQATGEASGKNITVNPAVLEGAGIQDVTQGLSDAERKQQTETNKLAVDTSPVVNNYSPATGNTTTKALPGTQLRAAVDAEAQRNAQRVLAPAGGGTSDRVNETPTTLQQQTFVDLTAKINAINGTNIQSQFQNDGSLLVTYDYNGKQYQNTISVDGVRN